MSEMMKTMKKVVRDGGNVVDGMVTGMLMHIQSVLKATPAALQNTVLTQIAAQLAQIGFACGCLDQLKAEFSMEQIQTRQRLAHEIRRAVQEAQSNDGQTGGS